MAKQSLDPSVQQFKQFINKYPTLCAYVHSNQVDLQTLYEKWVNEGEDDVYWDTYKKNYQVRKHRDSPSTTRADPLAKTVDTLGNLDLMKTFMRLTKSMDMTKVQKHVEQISEAVLSVQEIVHQFNQNKQRDTSQRNPREQDDHFFQWMKD